MEFNRRNLLAGGAAAAAWPLLGRAAFAADEAADKSDGEIPKDAVCLIARVKAKEGEEEKVKKALSTMVAPTRKEEGCIHYILHQAADDKTLFMFYEVWTSRDALKKHVQTPHMKTLIASLKGLTDDGGGVKFYELVE